MFPTRQTAAIRINPKCYEYKNDKFEKLIIHELLHPLFDPIQKEFERGAKEETPVKFHLNAIETAVDHLANVIYNLNT